AGSSSEEVTLAPLPSDLETLLRTAAAPFNETALAVRSSGVAEDLSGASFAGQYDTILNVYGFDALVVAIRQCWASAFSERITAYLAAKGIKRKGGMAVLVQRLVRADASGVAFSANPVTGNRQECVVNAVRGMGERLVSGQATPDEWVVRGKKVVSHVAPEGAITKVQALAVAELARRTAAHFGEPQDVEWAIADDELFMLQARPITALPEPPSKLIPIPIEPPPGFWEREAVHFPEPLSPMIRSAILPLHERGVYQSFQENSMLLDGVQFQEIGGWLYQRMVPMGGKDRAPPPAWLTPLLIRLVPSMRRRIKGLVNVIRSDKLWRDAERWYTEWKPNTVKHINQLKIITLSSLSDVQLEQHLEQILAFIAECLHIHALITAADFLVAEFVLTCQELLGWDELKSLELLSGLSTRTTEPTQRLNELALMAQNRPAIRNLLNHIDPETKDKLAEVDNEFADALNRYLQEYGCRTLRWDLNEETLEEKPELVLSLIRNQIAHNYNFKADATTLAQKRDHALAEATQTLSNRSPVDRTKFEHALTRAERAYPIREEHEYYLSNVPLALLRYALLEVGSRLTERETLERQSDVFFLELEEARAAFRKGIDQRATVIRRKGEEAWARAHPGPAFYGKTPPPPPSMAGFPPEVKHMMHVFSWMINNLGFTTQPNLQTQIAT
ncbi:MAG: PEP/pyruvate-binding domain-containing protein, partial [Candidatus Hermodarchaeia archaeon]